ncbi:uncharacterized protein METZ01_LOCUS9287 [marine metagenome]|uniref:Uncharacterized protein n=1 Tax=marine metagenome TaxID=408172 RepID=A0A381NSI8_9ZZZZ
MKDKNAAYNFFYLELDFLLRDKQKQSSR